MANIFRFISIGVRSVKLIITQIFQDFGWRAIPLLIILAIVATLLWLVVASPLISPFIYTLI